MTHPLGEHMQLHLITILKRHWSFEIENECEDVENYTGPMPGEVFTVLEFAMQWYKQLTEFNSTELLLLKIIKDCQKKRSLLEV